MDRADGADGVHDPAGVRAGGADRQDGRGRVGASTLRVLEYWLRKYRRTWRGTLIASLLNPLLYLAAMGVGLGTLIDRGEQADGLGDYLAFVAPGLLAATAMQVAAGEATYPVLGAIKWERTYLAMLATPLGVGEVLAGHLLWIALRVATSAAVYLVVMAAFGAARSPWVLLALPAALLTGMAFAAPIAALAATLDRDSAFTALFRFGVVPMFLFSGTFFPVGQLPELLRPVAYLTPLWHGVQLCRGLSLGTAALGGSALHVAYLGAWLVAGVALARVTFRRRLVT